jgi:hypothetical protein
LSPEQILNAVKIGAALNQMPLDTAEKKAITQYHLAQAASLPQRIQMEREQAGSLNKYRNAELSERARESNQTHADRAAEIASREKYEGATLGIRLNELQALAQQRLAAAQTNAQRVKLAEESRQIQASNVVMTHLQKAWPGTVTVGSVTMPSGGIDIAAMRAAAGNPKDPRYAEAVKDVEMYDSALKTVNQYAQPNQQESAVPRATSTNLQAVENALKGRKKGLYSVNGITYNWDGKHPSEVH